MARLLYLQPCSLDLRIADAAGDFRWAMPPASVHALANELERPIGTHVYGRRMWETMRYWATAPEEPGAAGEYGALWRSARHLVVSTTLPPVDDPRTEVVRRFDPDDLRRRKAAATADLSIGGSTLAAAAFAAGLIDEVRLLVVPILVGSGPRALPDGVRAGLRLREQRSLEDGWLLLHYAVAAA